MVALASLDTLVVGAVSVGVLHTLVGPDHYVPLVAIGKQRRWQRRKLLGMTAACGLVHCLVGAVVAAVAIAVVESLGAFHAVQGLRADTAAMLLVGLGVALMFTAARARRAAPWLLGLVFVLGPCEWMVPALTAAVAEHGFAGAALVGLAFTVATVTTMLAAVTVADATASKLRLPLPAPAVAGACTALCGVAMLAGL